MIKLLKGDFVLIDKLIFEDFLDSLDGLIELCLGEGWSLGFLLLLALKKAESVSNESIDHVALCQ